MSLGLTVGAIDQSSVKTGGLRHSPWFALFVLTLVYSIGFIDRQLLNLLVQPIKRDFGLSDLEISVLQGAAFSGAYLLMSPIFGRWVDTSNRRNILLGCVVMWSGFTSLCGAATGFVMLFLARSVVGAAEAGLTPAAWSMLSDHFDDRKIGRALSIYNIGPYVGGGLAMVLGGVVLKRAEPWDFSGIPVLSAMQPWQLTFLVVGGVGALSALLLLLLPEPARRGEHAATDVMPLKSALSVIARERSFYGCFYVGMGLSIVPIYAFGAWMPTVATRQFGIPLTTIGLQFGIVSLIGGTLGVLTGPSAAERLRRAGYTDSALRLGVITNIVVLAFCGLLFVCPSYPALLAIAGVATFFFSMPTPMAAAALQVVTPNRMRGLITSIYVVMTTLIGLGLAPIAVAFFTDKIFRDEKLVGDSLAIVCALSSIAGALALYVCLKPYRSLLDRRLSAAREELPKLH